MDKIAIILLLAFVALTVYRKVRSMRQRVRDNFNKGKQNAD